MQGWGSNVDDLAPVHSLQAPSRLILARIQPSDMLEEMTTLAITLREEHQKFIEEAMKSGRYASESEVVADALAELKAREQVRLSRSGELRAEIHVGLEQLNRGEGREWNCAAIKAKGRELLESNSTKA